MRFSLYIAKRYIKSKSGNNIINIVTLLAGLGVVAGTLALFIVLSVFSGIKNYSLSILDAHTPDIRILPKKGKTFIASPSFLEQLRHVTDSILYTKVIEERAFFKNDTKEAIAFVKGVDSLYTKVIPIKDAIIAGEWLANNSTHGCVANFKLTRELDLNVYTDRLFIYVPKTGKGYISNPKNAFNSVYTQVVGIVSNQNQESNNYIYTPLSLSQKLLRKAPNEVSYIDIKAPNSKKIKSIVNSLKNTFTQHQILQRDTLNSSFYKILNSERLIAYLVSLLVVVMVLSNTSGTLIMVIVDKKKDIKTLLNLGASLKKVRRIFALYGFILTVIGMFIGLTLGILLVYLQLHFSPIMITPSIPYPIDFDWKNVLVVCITIVFFGAFASLLASGRVSERFLNRR